MLIYLQNIFKNSIIETNAKVELVEAIYQIITIKICVIKQNKIVAPEICLIVFCFI